MSLPSLRGPRHFEARWNQIRGLDLSRIVEGVSLSDVFEAATVLSAPPIDPLYELRVDRELRWFWGWVASSLEPMQLQGGDYRRAWPWLRVVHPIFPLHLCPFLDPLHKEESCPTCDLDPPTIRRVDWEPDTSSSEEDLQFEKFLSLVPMPSRGRSSSSSSSRVPSGLRTRSS